MPGAAGLTRRYYVHMRYETIILATLNLQPQLAGSCRGSGRSTPLPSACGPACIAGHAGRSMRRCDAKQPSVQLIAITSSDMPI